MKKILLLAVATGFIFSSCSSNDDAENEQNLHPIVGTWKMTKTMVISGSNNATLLSDPVSVCEGKETYEFKSDNKIIINYYAGSGSNCTFDGTETGTYSYNDATKKLSMTFPNSSSSDSATLHSLNNSEMMLIEDIGDYNNDGIDDISVLVFNKQ